MSTTRKTCPKCRSPLAKTFSEQMICKQCGYVTKGLKVSVEEEFGGRRNWASRLYEKKEKEVKEESSTHREIEDMLVKMQGLLKQAFKQLIDNYPRMHPSQEANEIQQQSIAMQQTLKKVWFAYLEKLKEGKYQLQINAKKKESNPKQQEKEEESQSEKQGEFKEEEESEKQESMKIQIEQNESGGKKQKSKKGRKPKKQQQSTNKPKNKSITQQLKSLIHPLKPFPSQSSHPTLSNIQSTIISFLLPLSLSVQQIIAISKIYAKIMLQMQGKNLKYIKQKDIKELMRRRDQPYRKSNRMHSPMWVLLHDMLIYCYNQQHSTSDMRKYSLDSLVSWLSSLVAPPPIAKTILTLLSGQNTVKLSFPSPSLEVVYAFISIVLDRHGICLTTAQVINSVGRLPMEDEQIINQSTVNKCIKQVRDFIGIRESQMRAKWVDKICRLYSLEEYAPMILLLSRLLHPRPGQTSLVCISGLLILLKLTHNTDGYPYLLTTPLNLLRKQFNCDQLQDLDGIWENKQVPQHLRRLPCLSSLMERVHLMSTIDIFRTPTVGVKFYCNLQGKSSMQLIQLLTDLNQKGEKKGSKTDKITLKYNNKLIEDNRKKRVKQGEQCKQISKSLKIPPLPLPIFKPSQMFQKQLISFRANPRLVDIPSRNYQLFLSTSADILMQIPRKEYLHILRGVGLHLWEEGDLMNMINAMEAKITQFQR